MGVNGLWQVLQPCARPTNLATLNRQRLAVDASIWIYQFLKAVRDKEGHALRNAHVVGFFRRICKLLWFGILPVFVFDGGAPALKRTTLQNRRQRREGRRDDAVRTAGKLLAVQMQRLAEEDESKRKEAARRKREAAAATATATATESSVAADGVAEGETLPSADQMVYADEMHLSQNQRQQNRKFTKQDAYHLPEMDHSASGGGTGNPDDPRVMSIDELEDYARQFHAGEDINLYDFSKIDFDGEFFRSLPPADRYNILNAARMRSRLRMGLSKEQLDTMFPDRMAFSRFQIERVRERNHLTQRLMIEAGMSGIDLTMGPSGGASGGRGMSSRIAGERDREYILVKNDSAEGGWALGVVSRDKDRGEEHKPIDVDALPLRFQGLGGDDNESGDEDDEMEFEDVPIEGLNRLPTMRASTSTRPQQLDAEPEDDDALFVANYDAALPQDDHDKLEDDALVADEEDNLRRAIALSLQNQYGDEDGAQASAHDSDNDEERPPPPQWTQKAAEAPRPIVGAKTGMMVAHVVNNRANAAVAAARASAKGKERAVPIDNGDSGDSSDGELDIRAAMAKAAAKADRANAASSRAAAPSRPPPLLQTEKKTHPFDGPLPFEKLDWRTSIFEKKPAAPTTAAPTTAALTPVVAPVVAPRAADLELEKEESAAVFVDGLDDDNDDDVGADLDLAGGFEREPTTPSRAATRNDKVKDKDKTLPAPRPLPPWMADHATDIRTAVRQQQQYDEQLNAEDRAMALVEAELWQQQPEASHDEQIVTVDDSSDGESDDDVEILDGPPVAEPSQEPAEELAEVVPQEVEQEPAQERTTKTSEPVPATTASGTRSSSPEMELEDVVVPETETMEAAETMEAGDAAATTEEPAALQAEKDDALMFDDANDKDDDPYDFSDPEDDELLAQMAEEAEEHARFASTLNNNKTTSENQAAFEEELRALRSQQRRDRRDADEVTQIMVAECQALLRLFGIPYLTAPMEAEAQCAELVALGLVDGIVTDDSDTFLFGGTRVYKNMFNGNKFVECYLGADFARELSLTRAGLIALAQLLGSDYTDGLPGVGPVTAMEILGEFPPAVADEGGEGGEESATKGLEAFRAWWEVEQAALAAAAAAGQKPPPVQEPANAFRRKFRKAHAAKLFLPAGFPSSAVEAAYRRPEVDRSTEPFVWGAPDLDGLRRFLMATIGWSPERTDEVLVPVIRDMNRREAEGTQSNITRFLTGTVGAGARLTAAQAEALANAQDKKGPPELLPDTASGFAPRHAPRNKNTASSRRMAAAVNKLKGATGATSETAETAAASVMRAPGDKPTRKRKGARTAATTTTTARTRRQKTATVDEPEEDQDAADDDAVATDDDDDEPRPLTAKRRRARQAVAS